MKHTFCVRDALKNIPTEDDLKEYEEIKDEITDIDFEPEWKRIPVTLEVVKVSKFEPNFEDIE